MLPVLGYLHMDICSTDQPHVMFAAFNLRSCTWTGRTGIFLDKRITLWLMVIDNINTVLQRLLELSFTLLIHCHLLLQLTVYNYNGGPCYRCLFPTPPPSTACQRCADSGVLGVGISSMQPLY